MIYFEGGEGREGGGYGGTLWETGRSLRVQLVGGVLYSSTP